MNYFSIRPSMHARACEGVGCLVCSENEAREVALVALLRRDWAVRVLDAWTEHARHAVAWTCEADCCSVSTSAPMSASEAARYGQPSGTVEGSKDFRGDSTDAARFAAAVAVYPTLPVDVRAALGECQ